MIPEPFLWWGAAVAVSAGVLVPYARSFRRRVVHDRERKSEAAALGIDKPAAQYPFVDPVHCIGCGACVRACPEGDVLGIVGGTAVVVNGLRCVGHGRCEEACPVGAITVGLGDLKSREDVPLLDEHFESSVPGVFVVGELGGLSLVKNAIAQGRQVIRTIAGRGLRDVVIVGAGPAGLSAAVEAVGRGLTCTVLEKEASLGGSLLHYPRRKMVLLQPVEVAESVVLSKEQYSKETLLELFESLVERHALDVRFGTTLQSLARDGESLVVNGELRASAVVLALGRRGSPRKLGIPGEELPKVMYRLLDAEGYTRQRILVVGGGDSAVEAAVGLSLQPGNEVTLSYRREKLVRIKKKNEEAFAKATAIRTLFNSQPVEITPTHVRLETADGLVELANDYVFVFAGGVPPYDLLKRSGVRFGG
ncbi:MAG TPA: NAD(P)-binding domain-containing protein [Thermoanaerobaculia bacterium]|nr:NAD(P)-binding domain-containing protein [Thermoanaerobaculia bacterium]